MTPTHCFYGDNKQSIGATVAESEKYYSQLVAKNPKNIVALNHETISSSVHQVLPYVINLLQSKGYKLVTLAECLNLPAYQWTTTPGTKDVSVLCYVVFLFVLDERMVLMFSSGDSLRGNVD